MSNGAPPKIKHALNNSKLSLSAPCPGVKGKYAQLSWDLYMNNPRIVVRTNDPSEANPSKNYGRIQAAMSIPGLFALIELMKNAIASTEEWKEKIENSSHPYVDGKRSMEVKPDTDVWVGKDRDGCVYISVISKKEDRPIIKFVFGPPDQRYEKYFHSNGNPFTRSEVSALYANAYVHMLQHLFGNVIVSSYVDTAPKGPPGSYSKSNSGYNNSNNGGYKQQQQQAPQHAEIEEDAFPF